MISILYKNGVGLTLHCPIALSSHSNSLVRIPLLHPLNSWTMYPANALNLPSNVIEPMPGFVQSQQLSRSPALIIFGICNICISSLLLLLCIWAAFEVSVDGYFGIVSAIFHITLGIISIIGGKDTVRQRGFVVACLIMGIVGCCIFVITTITLASFQWAGNVRCDSYTTSCSDLGSIRQCTTKYDCSSRHPYVLNIIIIVLSFIEFVIDIVLSSLTCHNMCNCCAGQTSGQVIKRPENGTVMMQN